MQQFQFYPPYLYMPSPYDYYLMQYDQWHSYRMAEMQKIETEEISKQRQSATEIFPKLEKAHTIKQKPLKNKGLDDEWDPERIKKRKRDSKHQTQKEDRNAFSNIIRCFLKHLSTKEAVEDLMRLKLTYKTPVIMDEILKLLEQRSISHRNYVRLKSVAKMIQPVGSSQDQTRRIFVMLFSMYSKTNLKIHFLTSTKLKDTNRRVILARVRQIVNNFQATLKGQQSE